MIAAQRAGPPLCQQCYVGVFVKVQYPNRVRLATPQKRHELIHQRLCSGSIQRTLNRARRYAQHPYTGAQDRFVSHTQVKRNRMQHPQQHTLGMPIVEYNEHAGAAIALGIGESAQKKLDVGIGMSLKWRKILLCRLDFLSVS
jgi:hypothetical protein